MNPISLDADPRNANRSKETWDLPPYKSPEFLRWLRRASMSLGEFKKLTIYLNAVEKGLIEDDTWIVQRVPTI